MAGSGRRGGDRIGTGAAAGRAVSDQPLGGSPEPPAPVDRTSWTTAQARQPGPSPAPITQRDAVVFIPGIFRPYGVDQSLDGVGRRLVRAFDRTSGTSSASFRLAADDHRDGEALWTIYRTDDGDERPVIDLYGFDYELALNRRYAGRSKAYLLARYAAGLVAMLPRLARAWWPDRKAKGWREKVQLLFAVGLFLAVLAYVVVLAVATKQTLSQAPDLWRPLVSWVPGMAAGKPSADPVTWEQGLVVLVAAVQLLAPGLAARLRLGLGGISAECASAADYLTYGLRREVIAGHLADLLERIAERGTYRRVHVVSFCFGTVVALDSLFPVVQPPAARVARIHTLVTIGCPFDLIRLLWPNYFRGRHRGTGKPPRWINVYSPADLLGSDFRDDGETGEADPAVVRRELGIDGPVPENVAYARSAGRNALSLLGLLAFNGFRTHATYWERQDESEVTCFSSIVARVPWGSPLLR